MFTSLPLKLDWNQDLPRYWCDDSPFKTHFLNAQSTVFPPGERFFIHCIKQFRDGVTDERLKKEVAEFIKQENWHSYAHEQYDKWLDSIGCPASQIDKESSQRFEWMKRNFSPKTCLAITIGIEHITALTGGHNLRHRTFMKSMHPHFEVVWRWHSVEEIEHKSVAVDVWKSTIDDENSRRIWMLFAIIFYMYSVLKATVQLLHADKQLWKWRTLKDAWTMLFAQNGLFSGNVRGWLDYFKRGFHPNDHDDTKLLRFRKT
jgi:predicted metal-dependent hydrolase